MLEEEDSTSEMQASILVVSTLMEFLKVEYNLALNLTKSSAVIQESKPASWSLPSDAP